MSSDKNRRNTRIAVYLVGLANNRILLGKRKNSIHMNGYWSLPAGHVYEYESCINAIKREALEECGLSLSDDDLRLSGAMHHLSPPFDYINYIYTADITGRTIINKEPEKCEQLDFFDLNCLPSPMADYIQYIIQQATTHQSYWISEYGWDNIDKHQNLNINK